MKTCQNTSFIDIEKTTKRGTLEKKYCMHTYKYWNVSTTLYAKNKHERIAT